MTHITYDKSREKNREGRLNRRTVGNEPKHLEYCWLFLKAPVTFLIKLSYNRVEKAVVFVLHDREHRRWECSEIKGTNYWGKGCWYDSASNEFKKPCSALNSFNQSEMNVSVSKSVSLKQLRFYTKEWHLCLFTFDCRVKIPYKASRGMKEPAGRWTRGALSPAGLPEPALLRGRSSALALQGQELHQISSTVKTTSSESTWGQLVIRCLKNNTV